MEGKRLILLGRPSPAEAARWANLHPDTTINEVSDFEALRSAIARALASLEVQSSFRFHLPSAPMPNPTAKPGLSPRPSSVRPARGAESAGGTKAGDGVSLLYVDDHAVLVEGHKAQFAVDNRGEGRVRCVGRLPEASCLHEEVARPKPDMVLLDIEMPVPDAFETADRLHHMHPGVRIIILSAHIRDGYIAAAAKRLASGYFVKFDDLNAIVAGLREVARNTTGTFVMGPKVKDHCRPAAPACVSASTAFPSSGSRDRFTVGTGGKRGGGGRRRRLPPRMELSPRRASTRSASVRSKSSALSARASLARRSRRNSSAPPRPSTVTRSASSRNSASPPAPT